MSSIQSAVNNLSFLTSLAHENNYTDYNTDQNNNSASDYAAKLSWTVGNRLCLTSAFEAIITWTIVITRTATLIICRPLTVSVSALLISKPVALIRANATIT